MILKVMTFNIRYGTAPDGENHWDHRKPLVAARIAAFGPDVLGLQECRDDEQADYLKQHLNTYHFHGVRRAGGHGSGLEMSALMIRASDFQIVQRGNFWLSETPNEAGSQSWGSMFPRTATWAEIVHQPTGKALTVLNTHFDLQHAAVEASARVLRQWIEQTVERSPLIVMGDFNADKHSAAYRHLTEGGLMADVFARANVQAIHKPTFHGYADSTVHATIDWILASRHFEALQAEVDTYHERHRYPSDHYPVSATLDLAL